MPEENGHGRQRVKSLVLASEDIRIIMNEVGLDHLMDEVIAGLERALQTGGVFHIWTHPTDYGVRLRRSDFEFVVEETVRARERGDVRVLTMVDLADEVLAAG